MSGLLFKSLRGFLGNLFEEYLLEVNWLGRDDRDMGCDLLAARQSWLFMPEGLFLRVDLGMTHNCFVGSRRLSGCSCNILGSVNAWSLQINIFVHFFVRAALIWLCLISLGTISSIIVSASFFNLLGREKSFEDNVSKFAVHEWVVDVGQNAWRLWLNNTDVVDSTRADADHFAVHKWLDKLWGLANCFYAIVIRRLKRRGRH